MNAALRLKLDLEEKKTAWDKIFINPEFPTLNILTMKSPTSREMLNSMLLFAIN